MGSPSVFAAPHEPARRPTLPSAAFAGHGSIWGWAAEDRLFSQNCPPWPQLPLLASRAEPSLEDAPLIDPLEGLVEGFLGIGLEHNALARSPSPHIHAGVILLWEFFEIAAIVEIRAAGRCRVARVAAPACTLPHSPVADRCRCIAGLGSAARERSHPSSLTDATF
jgi:hypothetical protein